MSGPFSSYKIFENGDRWLLAVRGLSLPLNAGAENKAADFNATPALVNKLTNRLKGVSVNMVSDRKETDFVHGTCRR